MVRILKGTIADILNIDLIFLYIFTSGYGEGNGHGSGVGHGARNGYGSSRGFGDGHSDSVATND